MKHKKYGFTIIEMALFLTITGLLFVGIVAGTYGTVRQQRYNDSVQSFVNFWRDVFAEVSNTQNISGYGNTDEAIYGKLVVFGQDVGLNGENMEPGRSVFTYDVVADATGEGTGSAVEMLNNMRANVLTYVGEIGGGGKIYTSGIAEGYMPTWGAEIQNIKHEEGDGEPYTGSVLVVRHPRSGMINVFSTDEVIRVNAMLLNPGTTEAEMNGLLVNKEDYHASRLSSFKSRDVVFCVNSDDIGMGLRKRQSVVINKDAHNSAGIDLVSFDNQRNKCTHD